jgi:four helix bundle protein
MTHFTKMRVFTQARQNLRYISRLKIHHKTFGDIQNQIQRAAISVVSNIAEGLGNGSNKQMVRFLSIARGSNHELTAQLLILSDIGAITLDETILNDIDYTGKMLTRLIQHLKTG